MRMFPATDLQRNTAEVQRAAAREPILLSHHDKPRYVMMSIEDYVRLTGADVVAGPQALPDSAMARIRALEDAYPYARPDLVGGLAEVIGRGVKVER